MTLKYGNAKAKKVCGNKGTLWNKAKKSTSFGGKAHKPTRRPMKKKRDNPGAR